MRIGHIGALRLRIRVNELAGFFEHGIRIYASGFKYWRGDAAFLAKNGRQQVGGADIRIAIRRGGLQGLLQGFLCFSGRVK